MAALEEDLSERDSKIAELNQRLSLFNGESPSSSTETPPLVDELRLEITQLQERLKLASTRESKATQSDSLRASALQAEVDKLKEDRDVIAQDIEHAIHVLASESISPAENSLKSPLNKKIYQLLQIHAESRIQQDSVLQDNIQAYAELERQYLLLKAEHDDLQSHSDEVVGEHMKKLDQLCVTLKECEDHHRISNDEKLKTIASLQSELTQLQECLVLALEELVTPSKQTESIARDDSETCLATEVQGSSSIKSLLESSHLYHEGPMIPSLFSYREFGCPSECMECSLCLGVAQQGARKTMVRPVLLW